MPNSHDQNVQKSDIFFPFSFFFLFSKLTSLYDISLYDIYRSMEKFYFYGVESF